MGKSKAAKASQKTKKHAATSSSSQKPAKAEQKPNTDPYTLLAAASESLQAGNPEAALPNAQQAITLLTSSQQISSSTLAALTLLGQIQIELGDEDSARESFKAAAALDPDGALPEEQGGGAEKFLWLAQLSEEGGLDSIQWFERGAVSLEREITLLQTKLNCSEELDERRIKLASALCGMIEVWMTDLSDNANAESMCENLITRALLVSEPPQALTLQTLASIRLSQSRLEDAQSALERSIEQWRTLPPGHPTVPEFPTRISLARLLMEAEMEETALEIVERLVGEDDQSVEAWYLGGWCLWLMGSKQEDTEDTEDNKALFLSSREWLRNCLKLYDLLQYEDDRLRDHADELVQGLDEELGDAEIEDGDPDDDWIDEEDLDDTVEEDIQMEGT